MITTITQAFHGNKTSSMSEFRFLPQCSRGFHLLGHHTVSFGNGLLTSGADYHSHLQVSSIPVFHSWWWDQQNILKCWYFFY